MGIIEPGLRDVVEQAVADLARHLGVDAELIIPVSAAAVVWPDSSAGCPVPGMNYLQVQVDGARIELACEGRTFAYHLGGRRGLFRCDRPSARRSATGS